MRPDRETALVLWVAGGAACGGLVRAGLGQWLPLSWATLAANIAGSFLMALIWTLTGPDGRLLISPGPRFGLMAGLCGGLTTFSLFSAEVWALWLDHERLGALIYLTASLLLWLLAALAGMLTGRTLNGVES